MNISLQRRLSVWAAVFLMASLSSLSAQDIHFSQFYNSPLNLSPGLIGVHGGDIRFVGNYRNQWQSVPVPYLTFSGMYETKIQEDTRKNGYFSGAVLFNYDRAGLSKLSMTNFGLNGSYTHKIGASAFVTGGAHLSINQRAFRLDDLTFGKQFDGEVHNPNGATGENFDNTTNFFADFGVGANIRLQSKDANRWKKRSKLDFGAALFHVNQPNIGFYDAATIKLPSRLSLYAMGTLMVSSAFDLLGHASFQIQRPYYENVLGVAARFHLSTKRARETALQVGASYRLNNEEGDAIIPNLELHLRQWMIGASYDVNISEFEIGTLKKGGLELAISYTIYKVKPLPVFKICPII